jgi:hypothetical protein
MHQMRISTNKASSVMADAQGEKVGNQMMPRLFSHLMYILSITYLIINQFSFLATLFNCRYTASKTDKTVIYCMVLDWPIDNEILLGSLKDIKVSSVELLGSDAVMYFFQESEGLRVLFPAINIRKMPCEWAWSLKITFRE